jgi:4-amino-4-deoxy-L-arabinose transferase-like glycosyltransferase
MRMTVARAAVDAPRERTITIGLTNAMLALALIVGAAVRFWNLDSVPPELHPDEYAGWLGMTDMLNGHNPPSVFFDYGVVYLPLYGAFQLVSVWLLDGTIASYRLPAALFGVVTALGTGLVAYQLVPRRAVLIGAAAMMAILPWDISISRIGWEPAAMLPFLLFGLYFLRRGLAARSERDICIGFELLAVGAYSYRAEAFYAVGLVLALFATEFQRVREESRKIAFGAAIAFAILLPLTLDVVRNPHYLTSGPAQGTFDGGVDASSLQEFRFLYFAHFAPDALFLHGDGNLQHGPSFGVLHCAWLPRPAETRRVAHSHLSPGVARALSVRRRADRRRRRATLRAHARGRSAVLHRRCLRARRCVGMARSLRGAYEFARTDAQRRGDALRRDRRGCVRAVLRRVFRALSGRVGEDLSLRRPRDLRLRQGE